jgi:hypothetical protein
VPYSLTPVEVTIAATVTTADPTNTNPVSIPGQTVLVTVAFTSSGPGPDAEISVSSAAAVGTISLVVGVTVSEAFAPGASSASSTAYGALATERVVYDEPYGHDRTQCQTELTNLLDQKIYRLPPYLLDFRPDPSPETRVVAEVLVGLQDAARSIRTADPNRADAIITGLANAHGLPAEFLGVSQKG